MVFLVFAVALHALVFFGISFGVVLNPVPRLADTLEVVLVQWRSEDEPEQADYLAQASQKGGGETTEKTRPSEPVSGELPTPQDGQDMQQAIAQLPTPQVDLREIVAVETENTTKLQQTRVEQAETEFPNTAQLMQQSMDMASLQPEISRSDRYHSFRHEVERLCTADHRSLTCVVHLWRQQE